MSASLNAAPDSKGAYDDYATALTEMIEEGGLPLDQLFDRVRLRVIEPTQGADLSWYASHVEAPFLFFERATAAPEPQADRFSELLSRPAGRFDAHDAYLAALARDTNRCNRTLLSRCGRKASASSIGSAFENRNPCAVRQPSA